MGLLILESITVAGTLIITFNVSESSNGKLEMNFYFYWPKDKKQRGIIFDWLQPTAVIQNMLDFSSRKKLEWKDNLCLLRQFETRELDD